jgi:hypothetical protein
METGVGGEQGNGARSSLELIQNIGFSVSHTVGLEVATGAGPGSPGQTPPSAITFTLLHFLK